MIALQAWRVLQAEHHLRRFSDRGAAPPGAARSPPGRRRPVFYRGDPAMQMLVGAILFSVVLAAAIAAVCLA